MSDLRRIVNAARDAEFGNAPGAFRQCSLGWHDECSDPVGGECECPCHKLAEIATWGLLSALLDLRDVVDNYCNRGQCTALDLRNALDHLAELEDNL